MKREHFIPKTDLKIIADDEKFSFTIDSILLTDFAKMKRDTNLIDIGCGTGILMLRCMSLYNLSDCIGIEIQKDVAEMLKETIAINNLKNADVINVLEEIIIWKRKELDLYNLDLTISPI